ncbi:hypothetical protein F4778DRAFT_777475 [Xylariomycetidae sp. FL2044]|nr:hypothetical protein F4778DRAFT_777475 [Xylariomycetidae sp. FL2044]
MQKVLRRVATAERVAAKRQKAHALQLYKKEKKDQAQQDKEQITMIRQDLNKAKDAVRNRWELGPNAPRDDIGANADSRGAISEFRLSTKHTPTLAQRNRRCAWLGGAFNLNLAVGDRVVLLDGAEKGRIGNIHSIDEDRAEVLVKDLNKVNVQVGADMREKDDPPAIAVEMSLPISAIRLVHPVRDEATGVTRDVIINQLVHANVVYDRQTGKKRWSRIVPGLNLEIPWPRKPEPEYKEYSSDTVRIDAEARTFVPTLLRPPMPETVIDELRGRYSRFRTRHEPEYLARLEAEEQAKKDRARLMDSMRTPLQEFHRAERASKKKKGKPRLTVEMLEKIGEVIARNRERTLNHTTGLASVSGSGSGSSSGSGVDVPAAAVADIEADNATAPPEVLTGDTNNTATTSSQDAQRPPPSS